MRLRLNIPLLGRVLPWAIMGLCVERAMGTHTVKVAIPGQPLPVQVELARLTRLREVVLIELPTQSPIGYAASLLYAVLPLVLLVPLARLFGHTRLVTLNDGCPYRGLRLDSRWLLCVAEARMLQRQFGAIYPDLPEHAHRPLLAA
jgi:hypothetical protein